MNKPFRSVIIALATLVVVSLASLSGQGTYKDQSDDIGSLFENKYREWVAYRNQIGGGFRSDIDPMLYFDDESFREIVELGVPALPYMIDKVGEDDLIGYALYKITKKNFHVRKTQEEAGLVFVVDEFPDIRVERMPPDYRVLWTRWWEENIPQTPQQFEKLYAEWKRLKESGRAQEAEQAYQRMVDLGIVALPLMMEKIKQNDPDLIHAVSYLTDGAVAKESTRKQCLTWWTQNRDKWTIPVEEF